MLPDAALQRVAMMYKDDAIVLPLVASENSARKKARMAKQAEAAAPQPKVNEQAIMAMAPQPTAPGIAALQAPNMQSMADGGIAGYPDDGMEFAQRSEPVVRMAGGGDVARYQRGGDVKSKFVSEYRDVAEKVGAELGVDPDIILSQWGLESGWGTKTVGQFNLGNIKDVTGKGKKAFDKLEGSEAAYKSYKSPEDFARDYTSLVKRNFPNAVGAGRDVNAFTEGLSKGKTGTYATDPDYGKKLAATLTSLVPVGTAQAAPAAPGAPAQAPAGAQIPGQTVSAPSAVPEGFFSRLGSDLGMSEETKRNIGNILMAPTPVGAVATPVKGASQASGIERLYEGVQRFFGAPSAARKLTPEEIQAMQTATAASRNARAAEEAAEAARMAGAMPGEAKAVSQSVEAARLAEQAAKTPSAAERIQLLQQAERAQDAARATQVVSPAVRRAQEAKQLTALGVLSGEGGGQSAAKPYGPSLGYDWAEAVPMEKAPTKEEKKDLIDTAKAATPKAERKGLTNDDYLEIGLRMLADPGTRGGGTFSALASSLGRAGLGALASRKEREKAEREEAKALSEAKYREALTREAEGKAAMYEEGTRGKTAAVQQANIAFANWEKGLTPMQRMELTEAQRKAKFDEILQQMFVALGQGAPAGVSSQATGTATRLMYNPQTGKIE